MPEIDPASILGPKGAVAKRLPRYEVRPQQLQMAEAVGQAIEEGKHLMVEAGTGVGKSFAYLVPAIIAAVELGKKVVISTHTITLQEQLLDKDIPFLRSVMPQEFTAVLVKGRSNYISLRRLGTATSWAGSLFPDDDELDELAQLKRWADSTGDGSRSDIDFKISPDVWDSVASENNNCLGRDCPTYSDCHYFKARRRMRTANILVVNHALFMTDLALRASGSAFLPDYDVAIFDEAHTLESVAGEHFGLKLSNRSIEYVLNRLYSERTGNGLLSYHELKEAIDQVQSVRRFARLVFSAIAEYHTKRKGWNGRIDEKIDVYEVIGQKLEDLAERINEATASVPAKDAKIELSAAADKCLYLANTLKKWSQQSYEDQVYWLDVSQGDRPRVEMTCAPLDVGSTLRNVLFNRVPTCILTSATLCTGSPPRFDYFKERLGLSKCRTLKLGSPFDFANRVTIHLLTGLPDPSENSAEFERLAIQAIPIYLEKTHGKAFVLFTSNRMLETAARQLAPWFSHHNITLLAQTDGLPRSRMVEVFKADKNSVIFGVDSFWQGVDVPGEALSNVIIVRLPFSLPTHPLLEARLESIRKRGGNPFFDYQIPEAVIKLKQGFGRLIRTSEDRGIVVILDPRLQTKSYGRTFLSSLPDCPKVFDKFSN